MISKNKWRWFALCCVGVLTNFQCLSADKLIISKASVDTTNGFSTVAVYDNSDIVRIKCLFAPPNTNIPFISPFSGLKVINPDGTITKYYEKDLAIFFEPSNSLSGPVQLIDADGREVPCLYSNDVFFSAYPKQYNLSRVEEDLAKGKLYTKWYHFRPRPINGSFAECALIELQETFQIKKPGDYKLIVWPIIYKRLKPGSWDRSDPDWDLCNRVDLPPVSLSFHWSGIKTNGY